MPARFALLAISSLMLLPGCGEATEAGSSEPLHGLTAAQVLKKAQTAARSASSWWETLKVRVIGQSVYLQGDHRF
jgi:hypothetical protein